MEHNIDKIEKVNIQNICNDDEYNLYVIVFTVNNSHTVENGISIVKATNEAEATNIFKHDTQLGTIVKNIRIKYIKVLPITRGSSLLYEYAM